MSVTLELQIQENDQQFTLTLDTGRLINYTGSYYVVPTVSNQTLATKNKSMTDNVTITAVPYTAVSNPQGGETVTILS